MNANPLTVASAAIETVVADVRRFGAGNVETGGFLLAPVETETITAVALAGEIGIVRRRDLFQVSDLALDRLFANADDSDFWIPAQFHSHGLVAELSRCDIEHGLAVEHFVSTIVPWYADPPLDAAAWGWWQYDSRWTRIDAPAIVPGASVTVVFDENGVRGA